MDMGKLESFLTHMHSSEATKRIYRNTLIQFCRRYGHLPESSVEAQDWIRSREASGLAPATIGVDVAALLRYLRSQGIPADRFESTRVAPKTPEYLTENEISALLEAASFRPVKTMVALLYDTGARIGEMLGLKVTGINWNGELQVVRKGGREEWVNVSEWGMRYLREWLDSRTGNHPKVFGNRQYNEMYRSLNAAAKKSGLPQFHPHMLRHSRAYHLRQAGVSWEAIGYQLGHPNPLITAKYYTRPSTIDLKQTIPAVNLP